MTRQILALDHREGQLGIHTVLLGVKDHPSHLADFLDQLTLANNDSVHNDARSIFLKNMTWGRKVHPTRVYKLDSSCLFFRSMLKESDCY